MIMQPRKKKVFYISDECYFPANFTSGDIAAFYQVHYPKFEIQRFSKLMRQFQLDEKQKVSSFSKGDEEAANDASGNQCRNEISSLR